MPTIDNIPEFRTGTQEDFDTKKLSGKLSDDSIYFISDTKQIYIGENKYGSDIIRLAKEIAEE